LLALLGIPFRVVVSRADESLISAPTPREFALRAAREKCFEVVERLGGDCVVIGADTVVCFGPDAPLTPAAPEPREGMPTGAWREEDGTIAGMLGKPSGPEEAVTMLELLSGRTHMVVTAVAVWKPGDSAPRAEAETSRVTFQNLDAKLIRDYVATGEPLDKAGAYGAQTHRAQLIERVEGDLRNVIGLPVHLVAQMLREVYPDVTVPEPLLWNGGMTNDE
jgi:septum formation protein